MTNSHYQLNFQNKPHVCKKKIQLKKKGTHCRKKDIKKEKNKIPKKRNEKKEKKKNRIMNSKGVESHTALIL